MMTVMMSKYCPETRIYKIALLWVIALCVYSVLVHMQRTGGGQYLS
jgi:hypothetical protein